MLHGPDKNSCSETGACLGAQALHMSPSWPTRLCSQPCAITERLAARRRLVGGGAVLAVSTPVACVFTTSLKGRERVGDPQVFWGLDGGQERSPGIDCL